ncbi:MAG: hypothetical protein IJ265_13015, partial [Oscillospiraceae bacterium]|nr:hypothetical protein [Oscillospiraceae bacterium]
MKDFRHMINNYLLDHKKQKKYLAVVLALSILVTFAVPLSLMQPAESMTIDRSHLAEEMAMATDSAPATGADGSFESPYNQIPTNSDDFSAGITGITLIYNNQVCQPDSSGNYSINAEDAEYADVTMALSFKMPTATISVTDPCIYMQLPDGFTVPNEYFGSGSYLSDKKFSDAGYKTKPAYYSINKDGLIVIQLTQDYLEFIKNGDSYEGTLNFNGRITRAENTDGDREVTLGGHNIKVEFKDASTNYDVRKEGTVRRNTDDGGAIITWIVTAENHGTGRFDTLNGVVLSDEHFPSDKSKVKVDPANAGNFGNDGQFNFRSTNPGGWYNVKKATFTYEQYVSKEELKTIYSGSMKESNTAELKSMYVPGMSYDKVTAEVTFENTSVTKNGTEDYKTGSMNRMIDWIITVENPYGVDLSGYEIIDGMLSNAVDGTLMVQDGSGNAISNYSYSKSEPEGTLILPEGLTSSKVIIKYKTPAEIGKNYTNTVKVFYPNSENKASETTESVTYTNPYQLEKSASSFDPEKKKVYWEVTAKSISDHVLLDGLVITDDALTNLSMKDVEVVFVRSGQNSSITAENADTSISLGDYGTLTKNGSDITITGGTAGGLNEIRLRYATDVTDEQINAQATVQNTVSDSSGNEKTADKTLTTTYTLNKQGTFDAAAQAVNWTITVKNTASNTATLDGIVLTDAAFTDLFSKNFKLDYAYYPSYTGISGTVSASSNEVVFENGSKMTLNGNTLTFTNMDGKGVNEVKFTYQTPVSDSDIASGTKQSNEVTANRPVTGNTKAEAQVNNPYSLDKNGVFDAASGEVTWTVTVKNTAGNNASLAGVVLTDEAFANMDFSKLKVTSANYNYQNVTASVSGSTITFGENGSGSAVFSGNQLTFSEDAKVKEIVFQYNTAVSQEDFKNQKTQSNKISDS